MMGVPQAIQKLRSHGATLKVEQGRIRVAWRCPAAALPTVQACLAILRANRAEAIAMLTGQPAEPGLGQLAPCGSPHCAGCYDVGEGRKIHPPKCGEDYRKWLERWEPKGKTQ